MTMRWQGRTVAALTAALAFACGSSLDSPATDAMLTAEAEEPAPPHPISLVNTGRTPSGAFLMDFTKGHDERTQFLSEYEQDQDWIKIAYRPQNARFTREGMTLILERTRGKLPFAGGEFQRTGDYGYGRFETVMTASDAHGAVSSFFTHTDEFFGDPHDEIDFEFVGRSPRVAHLNYFSSGDSDPVDIPLWFDASAADHLYAFEWAPDSIRWYVDGQLVHEVRAETAKVAIPRTSGRIMANIWAGASGAVEWTGEPRFTRATAVYRCMSHVPRGKTGPQCSDTFAPPPKP